MKALLLMYLLFAPALAQAGIFGPSNYNECILDKINGSTSNLAAALIAQACAREFAPPNPYGAKLSPKVVSALTGSGQLKGDLFVGVISNNTPYNIDEVGIELTPEYPKGSNPIILLPLDYKLPISLAANSSASFSLRVTDSGATGYTWSIMWARSSK